MLHPQRRQAVAGWFPNSRQGGRCNHFIHFQSNISFRCNFGKQNQFFMLFLFSEVATKQDETVSCLLTKWWKTKYVIKDPRIPTSLGYNPHLNMSAERVKQTRVFSACITSKGLQSFRNAGRVQHHQLTGFLLKRVIFNKRFSWVYRRMFIWFFSRPRFSAKLCKQMFSSSFLSFPVHLLACLFLSAPLT